jgi:hypothetical protein
VGDIAWGYCVGIFLKTSFPVSNSDVAFYRQKVKGLNTPDICNLIKNVFMTSYVRVGVLRGVLRG